MLTQLPQRGGRLVVLGQVLRSVSMRLLVGFVVVALGLWSVPSWAAECPTKVKVADQSIPLDEVKKHVRPGEILVDPKLKEEFPDIEDVIKKTCQTLNEKPWPDEHQDKANHAKTAFAEGGFYLRAKPVDVKKSVRPDGSIGIIGQAAGQTTADNIITEGSSLIHIASHAGATDYKLAQTIVHEATHVGKLRHCPLSERITGGAKWGAGLGALGGGLGLLVGFFTPVALVPAALWGLGTLGTVGAIGGASSINLSCGAEGDPGDVEENMPQDLFENKVRWDYPIPKALRDKGVSREDIRNRYEKGLKVKVTLNGTVFDKDTGDPIAGASVVVSGDISGSTTTGGGGTFSLADVRLYSIVHLAVSAEDYKSLSGWSFRIVDRNPSVRVQLEPIKDFEGVNLNGKVVDECTGKPVSGASVQVEWESFTTSAAGTFRVEGLERDKVVTVKASAKGYTSVSRPVKITHAETGATIALSPEIKSIQITFNPADPPPRKNVIVTVAIDPRRAGVLVRVSVSGTDGYRDSKTSFTDGTGSVKLLVPGAKEGVHDTITAKVLVCGEIEAKPEGYTF